MWKICSLAKFSTRNYFNKHCVWWKKYAKMIYSVCSNQRKKRKIIINNLLSGVGNTEIEFGSVHQRSDTFSEGSRGRQCVSNVLISFLYTYILRRFYLTKWRYQHACQSYLHPNDLPCYLLIFLEKKVKIFKN